ncbi:MraY family glycosyltransferase [Methylomonas methanica]|uniref:Glycosyl transferase, family 4, conserved region-containing protein n=1 Tax=Methylomonas methanica (strain DSM 25384 / MC09) TaxID=857087 RepID=F9ZWF6_METMM|nr:glycosyltransferase family 4 protein [Methylomonas methanica]AEF99625.1 Glycosyl transferase, family 4, conserved region-containing protein [Methylomonas methanica MC09]
MLFHFVLVLLASFVLTGVIRQYALARKVLDIPNQRSSHSVPTPRGGGLAIVLAFGMALLLLKFGQLIDSRLLALFGVTLLVAGIGFCDDHAHVAARWRLLIHLFAAALALKLLGGFPLLLLPAPLDQLTHRWLIDISWLGYVIGTLLLVWCLNLFNFMDGTDGIAASESLFMSMALASYAYYLDQTLFYICLSLAAASLGFLVWNWPKAKIFMGDAGSGFIGLWLGLLVLMAAQQAAVLLYCGLILFGIFMVDASYTLYMRFLTGQKWYDAHCSHTYQRAAKRYGHLRVLLACWLINIGWLFPLSLWVFAHPGHALAGMAAAYLPLIYLAHRFGAGQADWVNS